MPVAAMARVGMANTAVDPAPSPLLSLPCDVDTDSPNEEQFSFTRSYDDLSDHVGLSSVCHASVDAVEDENEVSDRSGTTPSDDQLSSLDGLSAHLSETTDSIESSDRASPWIDLGQSEELLRTMADEECASPNACATDGCVSEKQPMSPMQSIAMALASCPPNEHPFLNMEEQLAHRGNEERQSHYDFCVDLAMKNMIRPADHVVSCQSLLNEAHRYHMECIKRHNARHTNGDGMQKNPHWISHQWRLIEMSVRRDMYSEGTCFVQRRMSCMCMFNPDSDLRPYSDNEIQRMERVHRQEIILSRLEQQIEESRSPFFLEDNTPIPHLHFNAFQMPLRPSYRTAYDDLDL